MRNPTPLSPDVIVFQSRKWDTNAGVVNGPEGALLIDPCIYPDELGRIADHARPVAAGFATHAHWDHILWHERLGTDVPRYASAETVALIAQLRIRLEQKLVNAEAEVGDSVLWPRDVLFHEQPLPWGPAEIAGISTELIPVRGHMEGQAALLLPDHDVCFVADTLSDIEIPSLNGGMRQLREYQLTLDRLQQVIDRVSHIVPGHGSIADRTEAQRRLDLDRRYLETLAEIPIAGSVHTDTEEVAQTVVRDLSESRAEPGLSWDMHLENVQSLLEERRVGESAAHTRQSSRLVALNDRGQVWMLCINDPVRPRWILPGGGLEAGGSWEQAASREMWEECGLHIDISGPHIAERRAVTEHNGNHYLAIERYFIARVGQQQPSQANMLQHEIEDYTQQRWWSAAELRATYEITYPIGLADLLDAINADSLSPEPIVFPD